ncbi:MAG TPA: cupin domain-containing protein [Steroidobacteraceae bacterium]|nr:cupin domain-containing protein [Steroidobacteraceae bacterium]
MADCPKIVRLDRLQTGESANPSPEKILAGIPRTRVSNQYTDATQQFFCGLWTSTNGKWRVHYTETEFCVLIEGRVRLESASGERIDLRAGDAFVVPAGFEGTWEVAEPCKKWYAIFEAKS